MSRAVRTVVVYNVEIILVYVARRRDPFFGDSAACTTVFSRPCVCCCEPRERQRKAGVCCVDTVDYFAVMYAVPGTVVQYCKVYRVSTHATIYREKYY